MQKRLLKCAACNKEQEDSEYDGNNIEMSKRPDRTDNLICNFCRDDGFTPRDAHVHYCSLCGPTMRKARANFDADSKSLQNSRDLEKKPLLICTSCENTHERCPMAVSLNIFLYHICVLCCPSAVLCGSVYGHWPKVYETRTWPPQIQNERGAMPHRLRENT